MLPITYRSKNRSEEADAPSGIAVRIQRWIPAMLRLKVLDDRRRFHEWPPIVQQQRELTEGPVPLQLLHILRMVLIEDAILERRVVRPKRDQYLLRKAAERVAEELEAHQFPS